MKTANVTEDLMSFPLSNTTERQRRFVGVIAWVLVAAVSFDLAYVVDHGGFLAVVYLFALLQLAQADTWRMAFYPGLAVGLVLGALQLRFFWSIFSGGAVVLWLVYAFWVGLFVALSRLCLKFEWPRLVPQLRRVSLGWFLIPFIWCGLEYFRSELYYLRFAWLSPGFAFGTAPWLVPLPCAGVYGTGFLLMAIACASAYLLRRSRVLAAAALLLGLGLLLLGAVFDRRADEESRPTAVQVAGVQTEFPTEPEVLARLSALVRRHPEAELLVLSEYTFMEPVPERVKAWCRQHRRYLVVGGKDPASDGDFYDTAFVISPDGEIVFRQGKSVPIQFFKDGLPAPKQRVWNSPWGKLGICVCYDLSYSRVTDRLIQQGAQALVVPTMDVVDWGEPQHRLHARVAPARAAEYGLPIFRVASSGISQLVDQSGEVLASAPGPGDGAMLSGPLALRNRGRLPWDRWLAPFSTGLTALVTAFLLLNRFVLSPAVTSSANAPATRTNPC